MKGIQQVLVPPSKLYAKSHAPVCGHLFEKACYYHQIFKGVHWEDLSILRVLKFLKELYKKHCPIGQTGPLCVSRSQMVTSLSVSRLLYFHSKRRQERQTGLNSKFRMSCAAQGLGVQLLPRRQKPHRLGDYEISSNPEEPFTL